METHTFLRDALSAYDEASLNARQLGDESNEFIATFFASHVSVVLVEAEEHLALAHYALEEPFPRKCAPGVVDERCGASRGKVAAARLSDLVKRGGLVKSPNLAYFEKRLMSCKDETLSRYRQLPWCQALVHCVDQLFPSQA